MNKKKIASLLSGMALLSISSAFAADITGNFQTTSTLVSSCTISAQDINFSAVNFVTNPVNYYYAYSNLTVLCSKDVNYSISPTGGYSSSLVHIMEGSSGNKLAVTLIKGSGTSDWYSGALITSKGTGVPLDHMIGAKIFRNHKIVLYDATSTNDYNYNAPPDTYSTQVTALITY